MKAHRETHVTDAFIHKTAVALVIVCTQVGHVLHKSMPECLKAYRTQNLVQVFNAPLFREQPFYANTRVFKFSRHLSSGRTQGGRFYEALSVCSVDHSACGRQDEVVHGEAAKGGIARLKGGEEPNLFGVLLLVRDAS